eukprot:INCI9222.4.p1 GENE.INCI9222.4~~INCI9222.4.p1  ORF type:complete len:1394 (+),score=227.48 INCI9222.4:138-4184(+)
MTNQFTDVIADFRRRATRDTRASALRASAFADETPFLRFQDAHVQHRQDHRQQQFQQRTRQPTGWRPGIQPVSAFSHPQSANSFAWPPPLLVDFGQLEISFTDWVTAGIELKEARRSEISLKYASDETRKSLSRQPHIVRSVAGDDTVVYIDNLCAQVPQLVRSTLRVGDELVTIGDVGAPKSIKFSPGTAVETIEEMVTQFAENDLELVFFRPLSRHIRRRLRHQRRHHSFNVPDIVPQAGNASAQARLADQAEDALHSSSSKTHHTDRGTANTETKARWPNNARRPESLNGVAASASKLEEDIYDRNNFISFAVRVELFSVTNLALATMNGPMNFEISYQNATSTVRAQHSDIRQVYRDSTTSIDEYDFVFGTHNSDSRQSPSMGSATPRISSRRPFGAPRFPESVHSLQLRFNYTRHLDPNPERTRSMTMFDAAYDDVIRTSPFTSGQDLLAHEHDGFNSDSSEDVLVQQVKIQDLKSGPHVSTTPSATGARRPTQQRRSSFRRSLSLGALGISLSGIASAQALAQQFAQRSNQGADDDGQRGVDDVPASPSRGRRVSTTLSQLFSSFEDHVFLRIFQDQRPLKNEKSGNGDDSPQQGSRMPYDAGVSYMPIQKAVQTVMSEQVEQADRLQAGEEVSSFMDCPIDGVDGDSNGKATFKITLKIRGTFSRVRCAAGSFAGTGLSLYESPVNSAVYVLGGRRRPGDKNENWLPTDKSSTDVADDTDADDVFSFDEEDDDDGLSDSNISQADTDVDSKLSPAEEELEIDGESKKDVQNRSHGDHERRSSFFGNTDVDGAAATAQTDAPESSSPAARELKATIGSRVYRLVQTQAFGSLLARGLRLVSVGDVRIAGRMDLARTLDTIRSLFASPSLQQATVSPGASTVPVGTQSVLFRFSGAMLDSAMDAQACVQAATAMVHRIEEFAAPRAATSKFRTLGMDSAVLTLKSSLSSGASHMLGLKPCLPSLGLDGIEANRTPTEANIPNAYRTLRQQRLVDKHVPEIRKRIRALAEGAVAILEIVECVQKLIHANRVLPPNVMSATFVDSEAKEVEENLRLDTYGLFVEPASQVPSRPVSKNDAYATATEHTETASSHPHEVHTANYDMWVNDEVSSVGSESPAIDAAATNDADIAREQDDLSVARASLVSLRPREVPNVSSLNADPSAAAFLGRRGPSRQSTSWSDLNISASSMSRDFGLPIDSHVSSADADSPRMRTWNRAQDIIAEWEHQSFNRHRHPVVASLMHNLLMALCDAFDEPAADQQRQWEVEAEESKGRNFQVGKSPHSEQTSVTAAERCLLNERIAVLQDQGPVCSALPRDSSRHFLSSRVCLKLPRSCRKALTYFASS